MTRIAHKHAREVFVPREQGTVLALTWSISRAGAVACRLVEESSGLAVRLEVRVPAPGLSGPIEARVLDADRVMPLEIRRSVGQWIEDSIRGVWHLDIEGSLKLTIRQDSGRIEALYARTELLAQAGVAGGRYEFEGAAVI